MQPYAGLRTNSAAGLWLNPNGSVVRDNAPDFIDLLVGHSNATVSPVDDPPNGRIDVIQLVMVAKSSSDARDAMPVLGRWNTANIILLQGLMNHEQHRGGRLFIGRRPVWSAPIGVIRHGDRIVIR